MKKIFCFILLFSVMLCTACGKTVPADDSLSDSETVPVELNYCENTFYTEKLAEMGITIDYRNTCDNGDTADFDMIIRNSEGRQLTLDVTGCKIIDNVYWGNINVYGDTVIVTTYYGIYVFSLSEMNYPNISLDISFLEEIKGIPVSAAKYRDGYAVLYFSEDEEGLAFYNNSGKFIYKDAFFYPVRTGSDRDTYILKESTYVSYYEQLRNLKMYTVGENNNLIYFYSERYWGDEKNEYSIYKYLYNTDNHLLYSSNPTLGHLTTENAYYYVMPFLPCNGFRGDYIYLAAKVKNNTIDSFTFTYPVIDGITPDFELTEGKDENQLLLVSARNGSEGAYYYFNDIGREFVIDFDTHSVDIGFDCSDLKRIETIDISPSGRYILYSVAGYIPGSHTIDEVVLKDTYTGRTKFIGELHTQLSGPWGAMSFISDKEIYHYGEDIRIYSTDMDSEGYIFKLSDKFPLSFYRDESGDVIIHYAFDYIRLENGNYAVVYCHFPLGQGETTDHKYIVSIFDSEGNIIKTYDTGVYLPHEILLYDEIYLKAEGNILSINEFHYNVEPENAFNGFMDLETGKFTYVMPEDR